MRAKDFLLESSNLTNFADEVQEKLGLQQFVLLSKGNDIELSSLIVGKNKMDQGLGSQAMKMLCDYADKNSQRIILSAAQKGTFHGTTSRSRLVNFYKRFGFKENKGKSIDFAMGGGKLFRDPKTLSESYSDASEVMNIVNKIHRNKADFAEGDLTDRIYWFNEYELGNLPIKELNLSEFDIDEELVKSFMQKIKQNSSQMPPIVFDPVSGSIIDGIHRANACARLGMKSIPAYVGITQSDSYGERDLQEVKIDNEKGLGNVPNNREVDYFGMRVLMKPSIFLKLARKLDSPKSIDNLIKHVTDGGGIGAPFLDIHIPNEWSKEDFTQIAQVVGHEGRHRMMAIQKVEGDAPVEVHLFFGSTYVRARHITKEWIHELQMGIMSENKQLITDGTDALFQPVSKPEQVNEAPLPSDWDQDVFTYDKDLPNDPHTDMGDSRPFSPILKYVQDQKAQFLGSGSSRTVHSINFEGKPTALKIAHSKAGLFQNIEELKLLQNPEIQKLDITAKLIDYDQNHEFPVWLQTEQMEECSTVRFKEVYGWTSVHLMSTFRYGTEYAEEAAYTDKNLTRQQRTRLLNLIEKYVVLEKHGAKVSDLAGANWGMDKNGMPKIVDLGYSDTYIKSYNRGRYAHPTSDLYEAPLPADWDEEQFNYDDSGIKDPDASTHDHRPYEKIIRYVQDQQAQYLGRGSSRTVHSINFEGQPTALKIAHNKFGVIQNAEEIKLLSKPEVQKLDIVASLIDYDKKNKYPVWLQTEQMKPYKESVFMKLYGTDCEELRKEVVRFGVKRAKEHVESDEALGQGQKTRLLGLLDKYAVLQQLGARLGDLSNDNWGTDKNGMPKIVDLGYSDTTMKSMDNGAYVAENIEFNVGIDINDEVLKFAKWTAKVLHIQTLPNIELSYDTEEAQTNHHTGGHVPGSDTIWVYANRNLVDILRTVLHELVHVRQGELGMIKNGSSYPGSPIEVLADAIAGKYIKIYGKQNPHIFQ